MVICKTNTQTKNKQANQHSSMDGRGAHKAQSLAEELLALDISWTMGSKFSSGGASGSTNWTQWTLKASGTSIEDVWRK